MFNESHSYLFIINKIHIYNHMLTVLLISNVIGMCNPTNKNNFKNNSWTSYALNHMYFKWNLSPTQIKKKIEKTDVVWTTHYVPNTFYLKLYEITYIFYGLMGDFSKSSIFVIFKPYYSVKITITLIIFESILYMN